MKKLRSLLVLCMVVMMVWAASAQAMPLDPYLEKIQAGQPIYMGPGYEYVISETVSEDGIFTIVEEIWDVDRNCWGRLKSGAGWVDLSDVRGEKNALVRIEETDPYFLGHGSYEYYLQEDSEYITWLTFHLSESVSNVQLVSFALSDMGMSVERVLFSMPEQEDNIPLVAGVVFYGDMTTYGLMCTDADGYQRCYTVYISGYDGSLVMNECELIAIPFAGRD